MRKIRYISPVPANMDPNTTVYQSILTNNKQKFNLSRGNTINFDFSGYDNENNKTRIRALASQCCAYCGVRVNSSNTVEVEHFRPKNELKCRDNEFILHHKSGHRSHKTTRKASDFGYYQLGNHYENMLPACGGCNRGAGNGGIYVGHKHVTNIPYGKKNNFPVRFKKLDGIYKEYRKGTRAIESIQGEVPLLFNPYKDNPNKLFDYKNPNSVGECFIIKIRPGKNLCKNEKLKATISINLLGLNRVYLCGERYRISSSIKDIARNFVADRNSNNYRLNSWAGYAANYSSYYSRETSTMLGFSFKFGYKLGFELHKRIKENFMVESNGILTDTCNFMRVVEQLSLFSERYYDPNIDNDEINDLIGFG